MIELQDLLGRLEGVKAHGGYWLARCPCPIHGNGDRDPSLSIREEGGRLHLKCFVAGNDDGALEALGLTWKDLVPDTHAPPNDNGHADDLVATYPYEDEQGHLLYVVERHVGKRFTQKAPDGQGGWKTNLRGVRRVLYRLPQVQQAIHQGRHVVLVEGEKDVHTVEGLGIVATTNSGGVEGWKPEYIKQLSGAKVVILYDNDEAGFKRATRLATILRTHVKSLKVVDLPGLPPKGDVTDWVKAGGTKNQLIQLVRATTETNLRRLSRPISEIHHQPVSWLWYPWIARGQLTIMGGLPGVGKSYVSMAIASTLSQGGTFPLADHPVSPGATFYLSYEDDAAAVLRPRFDAMGGNPDLFRVQDLGEDGDGEFLRAADIPDLAAELGDLPEIALVIIDPVMSLFVGGNANPNREDQVRAVLEPLFRIARHREVAILLLTHMNKTADAAAIQRFMGAGAFGGLARSVITCGYHPELPGVRVMAHNKNNLGREADPLSYQITPEGGLAWHEDQPLVSPNELLGNRKRPTMLAVDEWLLSALADNQEHWVLDVEDKGRIAGFTTRQVKAARARLEGNVACRKDGLTGGWIVWRYQ